MNRQIKFRAWDGEEMIILENSGLQYFDFEGSYALCFVVAGYAEFWAHEQYDEPTKRANKFPIMQFTGYKDRNDREVFEGDILKICNGSINGVGWPEKNKTVEFKNGEYNVPAWRFDSTHWFEVIGNIYKNPELLNNG